MNLVYPIEDPDVKTSPFGWRKLGKRDDFHTGIDYKIPEGTDVLASGAGTVVRASWHKDYGNVVIIDHGVIDGKHTYTLYAHLKEFGDGMEFGAKVGAGDLVGESGNTGRASHGPHLHFEIIQSPSADPLKLPKTGPLGIKPDQLQVDPNRYLTAPEDTQAAKDRGFWDVLRDVWDAVKGLFGGAEQKPAPRRDPLVIDLDGDGFRTLPLSQGVFFDHDADGFAELSGWIEDTDGLLALDRNGNGVIDDGRELFGDSTVLFDGTFAASGADALRELDSVQLGGNNDGILDASDAIWSQLVVWRDLDSDGLGSDYELIPLSEAGILAISLGFSSIDVPDGVGNAMRGRTTATRTDGATIEVAEFEFTRDTMVTVPIDWLPEPSDLEALPDAAGAGRLLTIHQAVLKDSTGQLRELLERWSVQTSAEGRAAVLKGLLFAWADAAALQPDARGGAIDARELAVVEAFTGDTFSGAQGPNPVAEAAILLEQAFHLIEEQAYAQLARTGHLKALYDLITYSWSDDAQSLRGDLSAVEQCIDHALQEDWVVGKDLLTDFARTLRGSGVMRLVDYAGFRASYVAHGEELAIAFDSGGRNVISVAEGTNTIHGTTGADLLVGGAGNDSITAYDGNDVIYGGEGDDVLSGCENDDQLYGGVGSDHLFGAENNDTLDGGTGNDRLNGGTGNDVCILALGTGQDEIVDYDTTAGNVDAVRIDFSAAALGVRIWRRGNDLYVGLAGTEDAVHVRDWYLGAANRVEEVILADGSRIGADELARARFTGTPQADVISGSIDGDYLEGLAGNDVLSGSRGDDVLDGGAGNDTLYGGSSGYFAGAGAGNDTYVFGRGSGRDVIYDYDSTPGNSDTVLADGLAGERGDAAPAGQSIRDRCQRQ